MKETLARNLSVGSRVTWNKNPNDEGTVIEVGFNALKVKWDDPSQGEVGVLYFTEMANIGLGRPTGKPRPGETWESLSKTQVGI